MISHRSNAMQMKLKVHDIDGKSTGREVELPEGIFGTEPNEHVLYLAVKAYLANQRQGTHKAKGRGEIAGSTRKLHKQKGTGGARKGDIKNPLYHGGGRIFGPMPRDYSQKLNKKVRRLARVSALSAKAAGGNILIVEDFTFDHPRTKSFLEVMQNLELTGKKTLLVTPDHDRMLYLSGRNLPTAKVVRAQDLHVYDILNARSLVLSESALGKIAESLA